MEQRIGIKSEVIGNKHGGRMRTMGEQNREDLANHM
jgi:hypothetical protein